MKSLEFSGRFDALDGLRYFASLQVVLSHQSDARWHVARGPRGPMQRGLIFSDQRVGFGRSFFLRTFLHCPIFRIGQVRGAQMSCRT